MTSELVEGITKQCSELMKELLKVAVDVAEIKDRLDYITLENTRYHQDRKARLRERAR